MFAAEYSNKKAVLRMGKPVVNFINLDKVH